MQDIASGDLVADFKLAMRRLTSTISLITTAHAGRRIGMAATAVQSVTADPATLLVCINRNASISVPLQESRRFAVNLLHLSHADLVPIFSGKLKDEARFDHGTWEDDEGIPVLADAQAALVCDVSGMAAIGSHDVFFGRVTSIEVRREVSPLLYEDGRFVRSTNLPNKIKSVPYDDWQSIFF
ncbi:flavin reductase family protein [Mesorhizobium sp.]|uniref:flavin reductase family protein n=1 Tax=Mesorhizobium sp. TaxID=1871066 RepID=UPI0025CECBAB|nr:flavin reductase family protein [Mesorhizobium sp.]